MLFVVDAEDSEMQDIVDVHFWKVNYSDIGKPEPLLGQHLGNGLISRILRCEIVQ